MLIGNERDDSQVFVFHTMYDSPGDRVVLHKSVELEAMLLMHTSSHSRNKAEMTNCARANFWPWNLESNIIQGFEGFSMPFVVGSLVLYGLDSPSSRA